MDVTIKCPVCGSDIETHGEYEPADRSVGIMNGWMFLDDDITCQDEDCKHVLTEAERDSAAERATEDYESPDESNCEPEWES